MQAMVPMAAIGITATADVNAVLSACNIYIYMYMHG